MSAAYACLDITVYPSSLLSEKSLFQFLAKLPLLVIAFYRIQRYLKCLYGLTLFGRMQPAMNSEMNPQMNSGADINSGMDSQMHSGMDAM
jgi:hypothetical protein